MSPVAKGPSLEDREAIWHDVECGSYTADLALWSQLAHEAAGPILELGAGTGRVALHLAREGFEVTALERDPRLLAALRERAAQSGLEIASLNADADTLTADRAYSLILAPMQFVHLFEDRARRALLERCRAALRPGGAAGLALLDEVFRIDPGATPPLPDVREIDGWVFSSQPVEIRDRGRAIEVRRLRQLVSPAGELTETSDTVVLAWLSAAELAAEAESVGLAVRERFEIPDTDDHVGSTVLVLEES